MRLASGVNLIRENVVGNYGDELLPFENPLDEQAAWYLIQHGVSAPIELSVAVRILYVLREAISTKRGGDDEIEEIP